MCCLRADAIKTLAFIYRISAPTRRSINGQLLSDGRTCRNCDKALAKLENIDDDTDHFGVRFVKINDKKLSKAYNIKSFPALTYFRFHDPILYEGPCHFVR